MISNCSCNNRSPLASMFYKLLLSVLAQISDLRHRFWLSNTILFAIRGSQFAKQINLTPDTM